MVQDLTPELAEAMATDAAGAAVGAQVVPRSPADKTELKTGDVVLSVDGKRLRSSAQLRNTVNFRNLRIAMPCKQPTALAC
jgi:serine protease Do/serine protease DegQ